MTEKRDIERLGGITITPEEIENATIEREISKINLGYTINACIYASGIVDWFEYYLEDSESK